MNICTKDHSINIKREGKQIIEVEDKYRDGEKAQDHIESDEWLGW